LKKAIEGRIQALANVRRKPLNRCRPVDIAAQDLGPYSVQGHVVIEGPTVLREPNTAQAFAFFARIGAYGSLSKNNGQASLKWVHGADRKLVLRGLRVADRCSTPTCNGFAAIPASAMTAQDH